MVSLKAYPEDWPGTDRTVGPRDFVRAKQRLKDAGSWPEEAEQKSSRDKSEAAVCETLKGFENAVRKPNVFCEALPLTTH